MSHIVNAKQKRKAKKQRNMQQPMAAAVAETTTTATTEEPVTSEEPVVSSDKNDLLERVKEIGELMTKVESDDDIKTAFELIRDLPSFKEEKEEPKATTEKETRNKKINDAARKLAEKKYRDAIAYDYEESKKFLQVFKNNPGLCNVIALTECDECDRYCDDGNGNRLMMKDIDGEDTFFKIDSNLFISVEDAYESFICELLPIIDNYYVGNSDDHILAVKVLGEKKSASIYADCLACVLNEKFFRYAEEGKPFDKIPTQDIVEEFDFSTDEDGNLYYMTK